MITVEGYITKQIFAKGDFKIISFTPLVKYHDIVRVHPKWGNISISGLIPDMIPDVLYKIDLEYSKKGQYDNYEVKKIHSSFKSDEQLTAKFLHSILTERQATEILKHYPDAINNIIAGKELDISILHGIGVKTMEKIKYKVIENFELIGLVDEFSDFGMTLPMMKNLFNAYSSIDMIRKKMEEDPYTCLCKINGVGFATADSFIMAKYPHKINSYMRCKACVDYILNEIEGNGHTWVNFADLYGSCNTHTPEAVGHFNAIITEDEDIFYHSQQKKVSKRNTYLCEREVANKLLELQKKKTLLDIDYKQYNEVQGFPITEEQQRILKNTCENNLNLLVGFGGCGKTFSTKALINMFDDNLITYILMSPTGKASKVLAKNSGREASTIHRGLEYNPRTGFTFNEKCKLPHDVIVIDEYSMVDIFLLRDLLRAVDIDSKVIFIGDPAQIPSVGTGNIAFDMLDSEMITTASLSKVFRYGEGGLSFVATKIRNGEKFLLTNDSIQTYGDNKDYTFVNTPQENTIKIVKTLYGKLLKKGATSDDIMVLTSQNKGEYGTVNLNVHLQELANPSVGGEHVDVIRNGIEVSFRARDKVMAIRNNYKAIDISIEANEDEDEQDEPIINICSIMNGDTGVVVKVEKEKVYVNFEGKIIEYTKGDLDQLMHAYALSIHKSQGSSSKYVILVTPKAHKFILNRNLLYVGVTRAEELIYHVGSVDVIESALRKSANFSRNTYLKEMLQGLI